MDGWQASLPLQRGVQAETPQQAGTRNPTRKETNHAKASSASPRRFSLSAFPCLQLALTTHAS
eukprot:3953087-Amphidinium_carterae.1